jgi:hypothetical protein
MWQWILSLMVILQPSAPWKATYEGTARAIDDVAHAEPAYAGDDGPERTAALLVSIAWYESRFDPRAVLEDADGASLGLFQVHDSNLHRLRIVHPDALEDPRASARAALFLIRESFRVCGKRPADELLAMYASGRGRCDVPEGVRASRRRMRLAATMLRERAPYWTEDAAYGW